MSFADDPSRSELARQHAFTELVQESRSRLYGYLFALVHNASDADDLFQATATILWEKFDTFEIGTDFTAWALKIASLVYRNFARSQRRSRIFLSEEAVTNLTRAAELNTEAGSAARTDALNACLSKLSGADRRLLEMCYAEQRKIRDVADLEGRTDQSVYSAIARIRRALAHCIGRRIAAELKPR